MFKRHQSYPPRTRSNKKFKKEDYNKKLESLVSLDSNHLLPEVYEQSSGSCFSCTDVAVNVKSHEPAAPATGYPITETVRILSTVMSMISNVREMQAHSQSEVNVDRFLLAKNNFSGKWNYNWDGMDKVRGKKKRHIYLIRHGEYQTNGENDEAKILTPLGIEQAKLTGSRLRETGLKFNGLTSSSMTRAIQTSMEVLLELMDFDVPFKSDSVLREGFPCAPNPAELSSRNDKSCTSGPRIEGAFNKYFHRAGADQMDDTHEIIVCHANVIRYFVCRVMQFQPGAWLRLELGHASITKILIDSDGFVFLRGIGETSHLPQHLLTYDNLRPEQVLP